MTKTEWAWEQLCGTPAEKLMLLAIASHPRANTKQLASLCGISVVWAFKILARLATAGQLRWQWEPGGYFAGRSRVYFLPLDSSEAAQTRVK